MQIKSRLSAQRRPKTPKRNSSVPVKTSVMKYPRQYKSHTKKNWLKIARSMKRRTAKPKRLLIRAQIAQLIELNAIADRGDIEFSFPEDNLIKTIRVTEPQRDALVSGALAIVKLSDSYKIVPRKTAEKIAERDESFVLLSNAGSDDELVEDEYAEFKVPDDLMW